MNSKNTRPHHVPLITLGDIYFILFRHKWKILSIAAAGLLIGMILPLTWPKVYESEAKLLIKYVRDNQVPGEGNGGNGAERVTLPDSTGRNIISTELQILTSLDLAQEVATNVGPDRVLGKTNASVILAAITIHNNLRVEVPLSSDVIDITFKHPDPVIVQEVLRQVINVYQERHSEIHRPAGADELLDQEAAQLRSRLARTEEALRIAQTNLGVISVADARKVLNDELTKIEQEIDDSKVSLAEHQATIDELSKRINVNDLPTNSAAGKPAADASKVPADIITAYKRNHDMLEALRAKEKALLMDFLPGNLRVTEVQAQITDAEKVKKQLETDNPGLLAVKTVTAESRPSEPMSQMQNNLIAETAAAAGLTAKIKYLTDEHSEVQVRFIAVDAGSSAIAELERTKKIQEEHYNSYLETLESVSLSSSLGPGKASGIDTIQSPSAPYYDRSKLTKASLGISVAGILAALGLAFLIELYIDRTVKRPTEIESRLGVPLFLSIPYLNGNGKSKRLLNAPSAGGLVLRSDLVGRPILLNGSKTTIGRLPDNTLPIEDDSVSLHHCELFTRNGDVTVKDLGSTNGTFVNGERIVEATIKSGQMLRVGNVEFRVESQETAKDLPASMPVPAVTAPWDPRHALRPFYDTLRDRLITYFEVKNLTHNPKLVALTSCGDRAGVTSTAAGLAAALSETGEGNVLLVDMNVERGAAHHFYKGHLSCGIDEALSKDTRQEALVQDNLYVVTESSNEDTLPRVLPKRFTSLVPKLKASDYDYIIFDMPPMSQISITPRLAKFMDMIMVVVESEKTDRDVVQRAVSMLTESQANVGVVLNKRKNYVPQRLQQEL